MRFLVTLAALTALISHAIAEEGVVVLERTPSCDEFVVETNRGYTLLEWYGGVIAIYEGDSVYGDLHSYGMKDIYIAGRGEMRVWVDDYMTGKDKALSFFYEACG